MKKILIFDTAICSSNAGDDIIFSAVKKNMDYIFGKGTSIRLGTHVVNFSLLQILRNNFKVELCKNADMKFICGTNLLTQKMLGRVNAQWQLKLHELPIYKGCVLIGAGCTYSGEKMDFYARFLYKNILSKKYIHSVRDEQTKRMVEALGLCAVNTGCPSLWKLTPEFCTMIPKTKAPNCVITVSGYKWQQDRVNDQAMIDIVKKNYEKCWLFIQTLEDEQYFASLNHTENIEKIFLLDDFKNVLNNECVDYVGTRLHGGIFALSNAIRSIIVGIDHRALGIHESNNIPIIMREDINNHLNQMINSEFETNIKIDEHAIRIFKEQFE